MNTASGGRSGAINPVSVVVVGLGLMGGQIAAHLAGAGHAVLGVDPQPEARAVAQTRGVAAVATLAQLPRRADVVLSSLPSAEALAEALAALPAGVAPGAVWVESSTLSLADKLQARAQLARHGLSMLDAPLSGTGDQAARRDLCVYASGDEPDWRRVEPLLHAFAQRPRYVGIFGNGTRLKFVANLLVAIHNVASAEAMALADAAGLDAGLVIDSIAEGAGQSRIFELRAPLMALRRYLPATMKLDLWRKDMALIGAFARELGVVTPTFDACAPVYDAATRAYPLADTAAVFETLRAAQAAA